MIKLKALVLSEVLVAVLVAMGCASALAKTDAVYEIEEYQVFPIDYSDGKDISGLAVCDGRLVAVSDKDKQMLYTLEESKDAFLLAEYKKVEPAPHEGVGYELKHRFQNMVESFLHDDPLDFEGVACSGDGAMYIVSENHASVLNYAGEGKPSTWLNGSVYTDARSEGYFDKYNAFLEGITAQGNRLRLAIERQQRGIIELSLGEDKRVDSVSFRTIPNNLKLDFGGRPEDVAGLTEDDNHIYTLERNAAAVCRRDNETYQALDCVTFKKAEAEINYANKRYGKSEGLTIWDGTVYVVLDNNGDSVDGAEDRRGRVIRFKAPADWGM